MWKARTAIAFSCGLALAAPIAGPVSSSSADGKTMRFGIGMALLASERCEGFEPGPKFKQLMAMLRMGAKSSGETLNEAGVYER